MKQLLERKHGTRTIVFALLLTMLAWLAPMDWQVAKAAEGDVEIPVTGGSLLFDKATGTITGYEGDITEANIQQAYDGIKVTGIGDSAFHGCASLTNVTIPDSVTFIGEWAFEGCLTLSAITVDHNNPEYSSDQQGVLFDKGKTKLIHYPAGNKATSYEIPAGVTSISEYAFRGCNNLASVNIPDGITSIRDYTFADCTNLASINIPDGITSIRIGAFAWCNSLASVNIPNSVTEIGSGAFSSCSSLVSINIPNSVTSIEWSTFDNCSSLASVNIPNSVTSIDNFAFACCSSLASVNIPSSVTSIGEWAFEGCSSMTSVNIPDSVTTIGTEAFGYYLKYIGIHDERESVKFPNFKIYGHSNDSAAAKYARDNGFEYTSLGSEGTGSDDNGKKDDNAQGDKGGNPGNNTDNGQTNVATSPTKSTPNTPTQAERGSTVKDKKSNGSYVVTQTKQNGGTATYKKPLDKKKTSVTIPATIKISGKPYKVTAIGKSTFKGNKKLESVKIGANVEKIEASAFNKCTKLKTVKIPKKVKTIQKMAFAGCKNLKSITIQTKKLTKKTVGTKAFKGVNKKATVKVPKGKAKAYTKLLRSKGLGKGAKVK